MSYLLPDLAVKKLVVFDFDGVLVDSVEVKTEAFAELYRDYGEDMVKRVVRYHRDNGGISRFDKFRYYQEELLGVRVTEEEIQELSHRFSVLVVEKVVAAAELNGAVSFIEQCHQEGIVCAINSATPEEEILEIVQKRGWESFFSCILGAPRGKSENLQKILREVGVGARQAIFFGDAQSDMRAAHDNEVDFIGIGPWMVEHYGDSGNFPVFSDFSGEIFQKQAKR